MPAARPQRSSPVKTSLSRVEEEPVLLRVAVLWIGVNLGVLGVLAVVDLGLLVRRSFRRSSRPNRRPPAEGTGDREASVA